MAEVIELTDINPTVENGGNDEKKKINIKTDIDSKQLIEDVRNWKKFFNKGDFLKGLILGVAPSGADIATDFLWAAAGIGIPSLSYMLSLIHI